METEKKNTYDLRTKILLSTYRALLGRISSDVRLITIDWGQDFYKIKAVFSRPTTDDDLENLKDITTEIAADFPTCDKFEERVEFSANNLSDIQHFREAVFIRKGEFED